MSNEPETLAHRIGRFLGNGRHAAALAFILGVPVETARSWTRGRRRFPASQAHVLAGRLRTYAATARSLADEVEHYARAEDRQPKRNRGFCVVKVRDGSGLPRDGRWRGGRPRSC